MSRSVEPSAPRAALLLVRYQQAMLPADADAFADLYHADAVHEFPFRTAANVPRLRGREEVRRFYQKAWADRPIEITRIDDVAVHTGDDPDTVVGEMRINGIMRSTGAEFSLSTVVVITSRDGAIVKVRDYMDTFGLASQTGTLRALVERSA